MNDESNNTSYSKSDDMSSDDNNTVLWSSSNQPGSRESFSPLPEEVFERLLMTYLLPVIIGVGTIGNLLSIVVLLRSRMRSTSVYFYLTILACADTAVLYVSGFKTWIRIIGGFELLHVSNLACKTTMFALLFALHFSAWLLVLVTVDRFIAVWFPFRATILCSFRRARFAAIILGYVIILYIVHVFWTVELQYVKMKTPLDKTLATTLLANNNDTTNVIDALGVTLSDTVPVHEEYSINLSDSNYNLHKLYVETVTVGRARNVLENSFDQLRQILFDTTEESSQRFLQPISDNVIFQPISDSVTFQPISDSITHHLISDSITYSVRLIPKCGGRASLTFMHEPFEYLKLTSYCILPFFTILVLNVLIAVRLRMTPAILRRATSDASKRHHSSSRRPNTSLDAHRSRGTPNNSLQAHRRSTHNGDQSTLGRQARVTYMLLSVSVTYIFLTAPFTLNLLVTPKVTDRRLRARYQLAKACFFLFMYANHAVNFYLYCLTGRKFRRELCDMLRSVKRSLLCVRHRGWGGRLGFRRSFTNSLSLRTLRTQALEAEKHEMNVNNISINKVR